MQTVADEARREDARRRKLPWWTAVAALPGLGAVIALVSRATLFPLFSGDFDEAVYVFQGRMLAKGLVTLPADRDGLLFRPWLFGEHGDRLFSVYQPGWPAVLAAGNLLGSERVALAVAAGLVVLATWWLATELLRDRRAAILAGAALLLSPMFVIHAGLYLAYLWTTGLAIAGAAAAVRATRTAARVAWMGAGGLLGLAQLSRPVDAFVVAVAVAVYVVSVLRVDRAALVRATAWAAAGVLPLVLLTAAYNAHVTGSPTRFPLQAAEPMNAFGFGDRRMEPTHSPLEFDAEDARLALQENLRVTPRWFVGGGAGLLLAAGTAVVRRRRRETWFLVGLALAFPAVYFFWWASVLAAEGAASGLGPHYYVPAFPPLAVLAGWGGADLTRRLVSRQTMIAATSAALVGCAAASAAASQPMIDNAGFTTALQRERHSLLADADLDHAAVILRARRPSHLLAGFPFLINDPELEGPVVYALDVGPRTTELADLVPDRDLFHLVLRARRDDVLRPRYVLEPVRLRRGPDVALRFRVRAEGRRPYVFAYVAVHGRPVDERTISETSADGDELMFTVVLDGPERGRGHRGDLRARIREDASVSIGVGFSRDDDPAHAEWFMRDFNVSVDGDGSETRDVRVLTPGLEFRLYPDRTWASEDVTHRFAEDHPGR